MLPTADRRERARLAVTAALLSIMALGCSVDSDADLSITPVDQDAADTADTAGDADADDVARDTEDASDEDDDAGSDSAGADTVADAPIADGDTRDATPGADSVDDASDMISCSSLPASVDMAEGVDGADRLFFAAILLEAEEEIACELRGSNAPTGDGAFLDARDGFVTVRPIGSWTIEAASEPAMLSEGVASGFVVGTPGELDLAPTDGERLLRARFVITEDEADGSHDLTLMRLEEVTAGD